MLRMAAVALASLFTTSLWGGVIQGVVLEAATNLPLARTRIKVERVEASGSRRTYGTALTGAGGQFFFAVVPDGHYVVSAERFSYAPMMFRSKAEDLRSAVLEVKPQAGIFAEIKLRKLGAITGRVLDENGVGVSGVRVIAYRARLPMRMAADAKSDDRGVYRIFGLERGTYWVRTAAGVLEDATGLLPTFHPHGTESREAKAVEAALDQETTDVDLRPMQGNLLTLRASASRCVPGEAVRFVLSSDTGRKEASATCRPPGGAGYDFPEIAPGEYELLAYTEHAAAHIRFFAAGRQQTQNLALVIYPSVSTEVRPQGQSVKLTGRRVDLAGAHEPVTFMSGARVLPGAWEFMATPPDGMYIDSIGDSYSGRYARRELGAMEWFPMYIESLSPVRVTLATPPASVQGRVLHRGEPAAGAPVHLYPADLDTRRRLGGSRLEFSDAQGRYRLANLPPGRYLLGSAFDAVEISEEALHKMKARDIQLTSGDDAARDLELAAE